MLTTRRHFLRHSALSGLTLGFGADPVARLDAFMHRAVGQPPEEVARDEEFWSGVRQAFQLDVTIINLHNGLSPSPSRVHRAFKRYLDITNQAPTYYAFRILEPHVETVRRELAVELGCETEEVAITRSGTESLEIAQLGLTLRPGDEVLTTDQDYHEMLDTWDQRAQRDGTLVTKLPVPVPPGNDADLVAQFESAITPRTRVLHFCHLNNLTGHILPAATLCAMARRRGLITIVDGAQAFAHIPFRIRDLGCDFYGASLHKWLTAPIGTGCLFVRREHIANTWPLYPAPERLRDDIRKFERVGSHPAANHNAVAEALEFHRWIGVERKAARMRYLNGSWMERLGQHARVRILTSRDPAQWCGIATVGIEGINGTALRNHLWNRHRILVMDVLHESVPGVRVLPGIYTTRAEIDRFVDAMETIARHGLPVASRLNLSPCCGFPYSTSPIQ